MATAWDHLPNAKRIDQILAHLTQHPDRWVAAWVAARTDDRHAAWDAVWDAADRRSDRDAAGHAAWHADWDDALGMAGVGAREAAGSAASALLTWDDCAPILDMPADAVRLLAAVDHHPAVLLLPAVLAMNGETHELLHVQHDQDGQHQPKKD